MLQNQSLQQSFLTNLVIKQTHFQTGIALNSRFYVMHVQMLKNDFKIFELYRTSQQADLIVNPLWKFDDVDGWTELDSRFIWYRRRDMSGAHLKIGVKYNTTLITKKNEVMECLATY